MYWLLSQLSLVMGVAVLVCWRQAAAGQLWWALGSLAALLVQAYVWVALMSSGRRVYGDPRWDELRQTPDEAWGWWSRLRARLRRSKAEAEAETEPNPEAATQS